jgi:hypothetical protein
MSAIDHQDGTDTPPAGAVAAPVTKVIGVLFASWCVGFAAVNAWQLGSGSLSSDRFGDDATVLTVASVLVLILKLVGAAIALVSLRPVQPRMRWPLGAALWAATATFVVYSAGNLITTLGTLVGALEPTAAWESAGGLTIRSVAYLLFFLAGAVMAAVLAVSYHRRHRLHWTAVAVGGGCGPALLGALLVGLPSLLATVSQR